MLDSHTSHSNRTPFAHRSHSKVCEEVRGVPNRRCINFPSWMSPEQYRKLAHTPLVSVAAPLCKRVAEANA